MCCRKFEVSAGAPALQGINTLLNAHKSHSVCGFAFKLGAKGLALEDVDDTV